MKTISIAALMGLTQATPPAQYLAGIIEYDEWDQYGSPLGFPGPDRLTTCQTNCANGFTDMNTFNSCWAACGQRTRDECINMGKLYCMRPQNCGGAHQYPRNDPSQWNNYWGMQCGTGQNQVTVACMHVPCNATPSPTDSPTQQPTIAVIGTESPTNSPTDSPTESPTVALPTKCDNSQCAEWSCNSIVPFSSWCECFDEGYDYSQHQGCEESDDTCDCPDKITSPVLQGLRDRYGLTALTNLESRFSARGIQLEKMARLIEEKEKESKPVILRELIRRRPEDISEGPKNNPHRPEDISEGPKNNPPNGDYISEGGDRSIPPIGDYF